jgi:hypothetical protein
VCSPVVAIAVRSAIEVFDDGRDPDGVEAQLLNVVEVVGESMVITTSGVPCHMLSQRVASFYCYCTVSFSFRL